MSECQELFAKVDATVTFFLITEGRLVLGRILFRRAAGSSLDRGPIRVLELVERIERVILLSEGQTRHVEIVWMSLIEAILLLSSKGRDLASVDWHDFGSRQIEILSIRSVQDIAIGIHLLRHGKAISRRSLCH